MIGSVTSNIDAKGYIDRKELKILLMELNDKLTDQNASDFIEGFREENGKVHF